MGAKEERSRSRSKTQGIILAALIAVAASALVMATHAPKKAASKTSPAAAIVPQIADVKTDAEIIFRGKSFPVYQRDVRIYFNGEITEIFVKEGDEVKEGDILATYNLDRAARIQVRNVLYPSAVQNLRESVLQTQVAIKKLEDIDLKLQQQALDQAIKNLEDAKALRARGMASADAVENLERAVFKARKLIVGIKDSIDTKQSALEKLQKDLEFQEGRRKLDLDLLEWQAQRSFADQSIPIERAFLKAPISGRVIWMHPDFAVNAELNRGFVAMKVAPMDGLLVRCKAHELELVKLREGDRATVVFDAVPDKEYPAKVVRIPWISRNATLEVPADYTVEFALMNPDQRVKGGMTCSAKVSAAP
ncbi:MAG: HlyD family secretion protein [Desulfomonile sp.]|nr:HlyD family secretion protein [Desulfomonile sp.]